MVSTEPVRDFVETLEVARLRQTNRATVVSYLEETHGQARLERHRLFTDDARSGLWTTETGEPIVMTGITRLAEHGKWSLSCLPDWEWYNIEVFDTQDPDRFWVECDGRGHLQFPGRDAVWYENHFIHSFRLREGKIVENREFMNPVRQLQALGLDVPTIDRGAIPADTAGGGSR